MIDEGDIGKFLGKIKAQVDPENQLDFNKQFLLLIKELNTFASERKKSTS